MSKALSLSPYLARNWPREFLEFSTEKEVTLLDDIDHNIRYVFLVFTQRSGSFYFANMLFATGVFNVAHECYSEACLRQARNAESWEGYGNYLADLALHQSMSGYFLSKITIAQLELLALHGALSRVLSRAHFITIERNDKIAQAISWVIADQTGVFQSFNEPSTTRQPVYDGNWITSNVMKICEQQERIKAFIRLQDLWSTELYYEQVCVDPLGALERVFFDIELPFPGCDFTRVISKKMQTETNVLWKKRVLQESPQIFAIGNLERALS